MITLTFEKTKQLLREAVAEKGEDYVYKNPSTQYSHAACEYTHTVEGKTTPGCLVGNVLYRAGVPLKELTLREGSAYNLFPTLEQDRIISFDEKASWLLKEAQRRQDNGWTWGDSESLAIEAVEGNSV